ncbi:MFS general substrate transporter [Trematosphaeria pertusa]|uniref:MFS general substrate transporter n=1 Tax=Trematosphaeria pertusa TaxID=390896 RepID=A0A6A6I6B0_9PLEO|nr:MFS general substrate transporter [Trematosphaeria pertusa]KAF2245867.1 MFS general substrate transporter [Trematosphaeria pertusa]
MSFSTERNADLDVEKALSNDAENSPNVEKHEGSESRSISSAEPKREEEITRLPTHTSQTPRKSISNLARVLTTRSNASVIDPGPPPDGGLKAWTQAFMGHFVVFNTWGMISTFGVFQTYYTSTLHLEPSAVSWIGGMQMLGHFGLGMFSGRALDAGLFYWVVIPGMLLAALGMFMTSLCTTGVYWQLFLAQGVMNGIGCGLQFTPSMSLVTTYFTSNRNVAVAIMASGSATGGLVYPTIARQLLPRIGFAWTVRTMGFIMLVVGACYCSLLKPRLPPRKSGPLFELSAFREAPYTLYLAGVFLICLGQYFAFYYISSFAQNVIHVPYSTSINLLMIMNGIGLPGRLIPSYFADANFGPYNTLIPFCFISAIILYFWTLVSSISSLYAFAILYGFFCAGFQGLFPAVLTSLTKDMSKVGTRNGMGFGVVGVATVLGPPIAGALMQRDGGSYIGAQIWGGTMVLAGSAAVVAGRVAITGWRFRVRV